LWEKSSQLNALAGGNIDKKVEDGGVLGIYNQNAQKDFLYKFAITTHGSAFNPINSMKFSLEHQNPLVTGMITGTENNKPGDRFSLVNISDPNLILWAIKPSEDGIQKGLIARIWNLSNTTSSSILSVTPGIKE
jgi:alpha-mannosidase